jgi:neutral ceramidase
LGDAAAGGAEDGRTAFWGHGPRFQEGALDPKRDDCQRPKATTLSGLMTFPLFVPMHAILLGNAVLTALPGEMTTTAGLRLRRRVEREAGMPVVTVGLSNAYLQYIATAEEYQRQHYEGASTLYGQHSAAFFEERVAELTRAVTTGQTAGWDRAPAREIEVAEASKRMPSTTPRSAKYRLIGMPSEPGNGSTRWVEWEGPLPGDVDVFTGPMVRVEVNTRLGWEPARDALGAELDDRSPAMWVKSRRAMPQRWIAGWDIAPDTPVGRYRFVVLDRDGSAIPSPSFEVQP